MKHAAVATLIASALALGCNAEVERTENFDYAFNDIANPNSPDSPDFSLTAPDHTANFQLWLDADLESHDFRDAKIEFSRIELGTCVERDTCATMTWVEIRPAHVRLTDLGGVGLISASVIDPGEYDEIRFSTAGGFVDTEDAWEEFSVTTQSVAIPLALEMAPERRVDVHVHLDTPAALTYDVDDGWAFDPVLTVESVTEAAAP